MVRDTKAVSWIKRARKGFEALFADEARLDAERALSIVAEGRYPDIAKPFKGAGLGVFELALRHRGEAYRVVYAVQIGAAIWVVHACRRNQSAEVRRPKRRWR